MYSRHLVGVARALLAMAALIAAVVLQWPWGEAYPAGAEQAPSVSVTPTSAAPGERITLQGSGWPANAPLSARIYEAATPSGPSSSMAGAFQADAAGNFLAQGTVPNTLFGQGSRGALNVVPGSYTIAVSGGTVAAATVPFTVGAPSQGSLLWGTVYFDSNNNRQIDSADSARAMVGVTITGPAPESPTRTAITDAKGRYMIYPLGPGSYTMVAAGQLFNADFAGSTPATVGEGQAVRADILMRPAPVSAAPGHYFPETGFAVDDAFWDYFSHRGGIRALGFPISRGFLFQGYQTQFFQRVVLQNVPGQGIQRLNLLDPGLMPYTRINGSQFPGVDPSVKAATPPASGPDYADQVIAFVRQHAPNTLSGATVGFFDAFMGTVTVQDAFPEEGGHEELLPLLNLELWGTPTSNPTPDPTNSSFVYLRFQRGILHFQGNDALGNPITEGILLGDWFKSLITGQNLPADLEQQARADNSPFLRQYDSSKPAWLVDPARLPDTDLTFAFERQ